MSDTRRVIGVCEHLVANKNGIAFPAVRVWIRGPNNYEIDGLEQSFPERGTVYLHVSACGNQHPQQYQVGLFECVESPGQSASWKVTSTSRQLARVIDYPYWERGPERLAIWQWLVEHREVKACNILLSQGMVYVRQGKRELVGPFTVQPSGKLVPREPTFVFEGVDAAGVEIEGQEYRFVDAELLPKGKPLLVDPGEAIHRRLKLVNRTGLLEWLSRGKVQELKNALAGISVIDGSEWVMEDLPHALEVLGSVGQFDENLVEAILQIKTLDDALEEAWKKKHGDAVKKVEGEIEGLKDTATGTRKTIEGLNTEVSALQQEKVSLENALAEAREKIDAAKAEAERVFDDELKRLAQSPASLALFGAWTASGGKGAERAVPRIRIQRWGSERAVGTNLLTALLSNLKACGLSPTSASEVAGVCMASLATGQPIAFRSLCSDMLAEAVAAAMGGTSVIWGDVPAGLLDSVDWDPLIPAGDRGQPMVIQAANRSDLQLVLGSLWSGVLRRAFGLERPGQVVLLTLESSGDMLVQPDLAFGALIDDRVLRFTPGMAVSALIGFAGYAKDIREVVPVTEEEFRELGDGVCSLPLFGASAQQLVFRRAYGALMRTGEAAQADRLFFKYWCFPRISSGDASKILEEHKKAWENDKVLGELGEAVRRA